MVAASLSSIAAHSPQVQDALRAMEQLVRAPGGRPLLLIMLEPRRLSSYWPALQRKVTDPPAKEYLYYMIDFVGHKNHG